MIILEDLKGSIDEEAHQLRLQQSHLFFQSVVDETSSDLNEDQVLLYLHDYWSVIRNNTAKFLKSKLNLLSKEKTEKILQRLNDAVEDPSGSWQSLHGSILGWISLIPVISQDRLDLLTDICLKNIGHMRNPIRDVCKDALVKIFQQSKAQQKFVNNVMNLIKDTLQEETNESNINEISTLKVDGLLSCLAEFVPLLDVRYFDLHQPSTPSSVFITLNQNFSFQDFVGSLRLCMLHPASTVRQKAGSIVSKVLAALMQDQLKLSAKMEHGNQKNSFNFIIDSLMIDLLTVSSLDAWHGQEIALIICDEFIRSFILLFFSQLSPINNPSSLRIDLNLPIAETFRLISFLIDNVIYFICHPRFEVRRVILQIIPTLARGMTLIEGLPTKDLSSCTYYDTFGNKLLLSKHFLSTVEMIWISTLIKENRHLYEILISTDQNHESLLPNENWSNEVHGRLLEVELRNEFHDNLVKLMKSDSKENLYFLTDCLLVNDSHILNLIELYFLKVSKQTSEGIDPLGGFERFISMDFVEFFMLISVFLEGIRKRPYPIFKDRFTALSMKAEHLLQVIEDHVLAWLSIVVYLQYASSHHSEVKEKKTPTQISLKIIEKFVIDSPEASFSPFLIINYWKMGCEYSGIRLLPTLTDPATNPLIYAHETVLMETYPQNEDRNTSPEVSAPNSRPVSLNLTAPQTPSRPSQSHSPGISLPSPNIKVLPLASPNRLGAGSNLPVVSTINSFPAMNQWNCEAISPMLYLFSANRENSRVGVILSAVIIEWIHHCLLDALWLDNRRFAKRTLIESLPILLSLDFSDFESRKDIFSLLTMSIFEEIVETFLVTVNQTVDLKILIPLFKSTRSCVTKLSLFQNFNFEEFRLSRNQLLVLLTHYQEKYSSAASSDIPVKSIQNAFQKRDETVEDEHQDEDQVSDEFSDWDEDEEESDVADIQTNQQQQFSLQMNLCSEIAQIRTLIESITK
eukprot:gene2929-3116_t